MSIKARLSKRVVPLLFVNDLFHVNQAYLLY